MILVEILRFILKLINCAILSLTLKQLNITPVSRDLIPRFRDSLRPGQVFILPYPEVVNNEGAKKKGRK